MLKDLDIESRKPDKQEPEDDKAKLIRFMEELQSDADAVRDQTEECESDIRFNNMIGGQWEDFFEDEMRNEVRMQFPLIDKFIKSSRSEWNNNKTNVKFKPGDDLGTSDKDAALLNSVYRSDFRNRGMGKKAIQTAVLEVMNCGVGAYMWGERFADPEDRDSDQKRIEPRAIPEAYKHVIWDIGAQSIDKSDASRVVRLRPYDKRSFKKEFKDKNPVSAFDPSNIWAYGGSLATQAKDMVFLATRWEVRKIKTKQYLYINEKTQKLHIYPEKEHKEIEGDLKKIKFMKFYKEQDRVKTIVEKYVFSGDEIFEGPTLVAGEYLPIIPIFGERIYISGEEWYWGFVRPYKDISRAFNQALSKASQTAGSSGTRIPIYTIDQVMGEGEAERQIGEDLGVRASLANPKKKPYLLLHPQRDKDGTPMPLGQVPYLEPEVLDPATAGLIETIPPLVNEHTTGIIQETIDSNLSGKAITEARKLTNLMTQPVMENIATGIEWGGVVYASKVAELYVNPMVIRTIEEDGSEATRELMKMATDENTGRPIITNDLSKKRFKAYADIGPQFETQRQEAVDTGMKMLETLIPVEAAQVFIPEILLGIIENMAGDGFAGLKKMARKQRLLAGDVDPEGEEDFKVLEKAKQEAEAAEPTPNDKFLEAEATRATAEAGNLEAGAEQKIKDAALKEAKTIEILEGIGIDKEKLANDKEKLANERQRDRFNEFLKFEEAQQAKQPN